MTFPVTDGRTVTHVGPNSPVAEQNVTGTSARSSTGGTLTRTDGGTGFQSLGLFVGEPVQFTCTTGNDGTPFTIRSISEDGTTLAFTRANAVTAGTDYGFTPATTPATTPALPTAAGGLTQGSPYTVVLVNGNVLRRDPSDGNAYVQYASAGTGVQGFSTVVNTQAVEPAARRR